MIYLNIGDKLDKFRVTLDKLFIKKCDKKLKLKILEKSREVDYIIEN